MNAASALIVDDEPDIRALIAMTLGRVGFNTHTAANLEEARHLLGAYSFDVCLTDMRLPDGSGIELVQHVQEKFPDLPIAVITAHGNMEAAVEAMKSGAFDFMSKPVDMKRLRAVAMQATRGRTLVHERSVVDGSGACSRSTPTAGAAESPPPGTVLPFSEESEPCGRPSAERATAGAPRELVGGDRLVGDSVSLRDLRKLIAKVARTNAPVWITGESGTGKELIARLIHDNGPRSAGPFVAINCGAIPSELMESELFGHQKGSFTGAVSNKEGLFRLAEGGTLFLDEVASLPLHTQVKLLRAIQERSVRPVGGSEEIPVDARILSASHEDLGGAVESGHFRHDLYYRLNVICISAPALRERLDDIPLLIRAILDRMAEEGGVDARSRVLEPEAVEALCAHAFPGNVRELENILERAVTLSEGSIIRVEDLHLDSVAADTPSGVSLVRMRGATRPGRLSTGQDANEREHIRAALDSNRWNRRAAADALGLTYRQLRYRIQRHELDKD